MSKASHPTVALTHQISQWLQRSGVTGEPMSGLPVDLADALAAAERVRTLLDELLRLDMAQVSQAEKALAIAADMEAQISSELLPHVTSLERVWPSVVEGLGERVSNNGDEE
jgi:hypothetical protein